MKRKKLTTASGIPYSGNEDSMTVGNKGPILLQDYHLHEKLAHFNRERIPERVVHAKGTGAFGKFTVSKDITEYTRAKLFSKVITDKGKQNTINNLVGALSGVTGPKKDEIITRQLNHFYKADKELALQIAKELGFTYDGGK